MTTSPWWVGLDDAALVALGSAGLLRRAKAARVGAVLIQGATAELEVEGFAVTVGTKGIGSARCRCPATGLCLHVIAALLALQSEGPAPEQDVAAEERGDAVDQFGDRVGAGVEHEGGRGSSRRRWRLLRSGGRHENEEQR